MFLGQRIVAAGVAAVSGWGVVSVARDGAAAGASKACASVIGFGRTVIATPFVQKGIGIAASWAHAIANMSVAQEVGSAASTAYNFVATKAVVAGNWVATTSVGQKAIAFSTEKAFPYIVTTAKSLTVVSNITPLHGCLFTGAVSFMGTGFSNWLQGTGHWAAQSRSEEFFRKHLFISLTLGHAIAGVVVYGASVGLAAVGVATSAITVPGAIALTGVALTATIVMKIAQKTFSCCCGSKKPKKKKNNLLTHRQNLSGHKRSNSSTETEKEEGHGHLRRSR